MGLLLSSPKMDKIFPHWLDCWYFRYTICRRKLTNSDFWWKIFTTFVLLVSSRRQGAKEKSVIGQNGISICSLSLYVPNFLLFSRKLSLAQTVKEWWPSIETQSCRTNQAIDIKALLRPRHIWFISSLSIIFPLFLFLQFSNFIIRMAWKVQAVNIFRDFCKGKEECFGE